jgi:hypothetical protein
MNAMAAMLCLTRVLAVITDVNGINLESLGRFISFGIQCRRTAACRVVIGKVVTKRRNN